MIQMWAHQSATYVNCSNRFIESVQLAGEMKNPRQIPTELPKKTLAIIIAIVDFVT